VVSNCRCAWIPANVGEDKAGQKRSKGEVEGAVDDSVRAEGPTKKPKTLGELKNKTKWPGADVTVPKTRPKSVLEPPTPKGGFLTLAELDTAAEKAGRAKFGEPGERGRGLVRAKAVKIKRVKLSKLQKLGEEGGYVDEFEYIFDPSTGKVPLDVSSTPWKEAHRGWVAGDGKIYTSVDDVITIIDIDIPLPKSAASVIKPPVPKTYLEMTAKELSEEYQKAKTSWDIQFPQGIPGEGMPKTFAVSRRGQTISGHIDRLKKEIGPSRIISTTPPKTAAGVDKDFNLAVKKRYGLDKTDFTADQSKLNDSGLRWALKREGLPGGLNDLAIVQRKELLGLRTVKEQEVWLRMHGKLRAPGPPPKAVKLPKVQLQPRPKVDDLVAVEKEHQKLYRNLTVEPDGTVQCHTGVAEIEAAHDMSGSRVYMYDEAKWGEVEKYIDLDDVRKYIKDRRAIELLTDMKDESILGHSFIRRGGHYVDPYLNSLGVPQSEIDAVGRYLEPLYQKVKM